MFYQNIPCEVICKINNQKSLISIDNEYGSIEIMVLTDDLREKKIENKDFLKMEREHFKKMNNEVSKKKEEIRKIKKEQEKTDEAHPAIKFLQEYYENKTTHVKINDDYPRIKQVRDHPIFLRIDNNSLQLITCRKNNGGGTDYYHEPEIISSRFNYENEIDKEKIKEFYENKDFSNFNYHEFIRVKKEIEKNGFDFLEDFKKKMDDSTKEGRDTARKKEIKKKEDELEELKNENPFDLI